MHPVQKLLTHTGQDDKRSELTLKKITTSPELDQERCPNWWSTDLTQNSCVGDRIRFPVESKQLLTNLYLSLHGQALGIIRIEQELVGSLSG